MVIIRRSLKHVEVIDGLERKGKRLGSLVDASDEVGVKVGQ